MNLDALGDVKNKRIVITRAQEDAEKMAKDIEHRGAIAIIYPCIEIKSLSHSKEMQAASDKVASGYYDWIVFTSRYAVEGTVIPYAKRSIPDGPAYSTGPSELEMDSRLRGKDRTAAIGAATAAALPSPPNFTPSQATAKCLGQEIPVQPGDKILLPQSAIARPELSDILRSRGCEVDIVCAYQTVLGTGGPNLTQIHARNPIDAIFFASPSAIHNFKKRIQAEGGSLEGYRSAKILSIGPTTRAACESLLWG